MNGRERALRAMEGLPVDHVPMTFFYHMDGMTLEEQLEWYKASEMDLVCLVNDGYEMYPMDLPTGTVEDFRNIPRLSRDDPYFRGQIDRVNKIIEGLNGEKAITYLFYTPFSMLKHRLGDETSIMAYWKENKQVLIDAMAVMEEANYLLLRLLKEETDVDGTLVSLQNAEVDRFSPEEYEDYLTRWDISLMAHAKHFFRYNVFHLCSWVGIPNHMQLWKDSDYGCVHWGVHIEKDLDLRQARNFFRDGTVIMGGFDNRPQGILYHGAKQEVKEYTKGLIRSAGEVGYFISSDCSVARDVPLERLRWVKEAAMEYAAGK